VGKIFQNIGVLVSIHTAYVVTVVSCSHFYLHTVTLCTFVFRIVFLCKKLNSPGQDGESGLVSFGCRRFQGAIHSTPVRSASKVGYSAFSSTRMQAEVVSPRQLMSSPGMTNPGMRNVIVMLAQEIKRAQRDKYKNFTIAS